MIFRAKSRVVRMPRKVIQKWHDEFKASWAGELAWAKEHPEREHSCEDAERKLWGDGTIKALAWLLAHPKGTVPKTTKCQWSHCFCTPPMKYAPGELCELCESNRKAWNLSASFNNDVLNPLRDMGKGFKKIGRFFFFGGWQDGR